MNNRILPRTKRFPQEPVEQLKSFRAGKRKVDLTTVFWSLFLRFCIHLKNLTAFLACVSPKELSVVLHTQFVFGTVLEVKLFEHEEPLNSLRFLKRFSLRTFSEMETLYAAAIVGSFWRTTIWSSHDFCTSLPFWRTFFGPNLSSAFWKNSLQTFSIIYNKFLGKLKVLHFLKEHYWC